MTYYLEATHNYIYAVTETNFKINRNLTNAKISYLPVAQIL